MSVKISSITCATSLSLVAKGICINININVISSFYCFLFCLVTCSFSPCIYSDLYIKGVCSLIT